MTKAAEPRSCLYEGEVRHRRFRPAAHAFQYRLFLACLDLDEVDSLLGRRGLWSIRRPALARFCRADHLGDPARPLADCVRELVETRTGWRPSGPIRLLTHLRYFGYLINPVSFYYCYDASGERVEAVVAEVNNTPWNERHCYVLDLRGQSSPRFKARHPKTFHVSPFLSLQMGYRWSLTAPGERLAVRIVNEDSLGKPFEATLVLRRRPFTAWQRCRALLRYPFMTIQVVAAIYWQALRLWWKGVPYVPHPGPPASAGAPVS